MIVTSERGSSRITELGRKMCTFPVAPRFARMLTMAASLGNTKIVEYVIIIVSALSVQELFVDDQLLAETEVIRRHTNRNHLHNIFKNFNF